MGSTHWRCGAEISAAHHKILEDEILSEADGVDTHRVFKTNTALSTQRHVVEIAAVRHQSRNHVAAVKSPYPGRYREQLDHVIPLDFQLQGNFEIETAPKRSLRKFHDHHGIVPDGKRHTLICPGHR